ncbi:MULTISPECIES: hypothetical protein [unclassified Streptomyces]|uniref:hypothetical protein n=1 Tax=unclassified Streptomyces TaxID=2593676 RepID=UPI00278BCE65|nr:MULTISPECIES: hypothetical protein [unclassified Streptomyces]
MGLALAAMVGGGLFWYLDSQGPQDDGPHQLSAPSTLSFAPYYRAGEESDPHLGLGTADPEELARYDIKTPTEIAATYSDELLDGADSSDPNAAQDTLRRAQNSKRFTVSGAYGEFNNPELALSHYFGLMRDSLRESTRKAPGNVVSSLSSEEETETDSLDGAVLACATLDVDNFDSDDGDRETRVCGWADYSTVGLVTPYDGTFGLSTEEAAELTGKVRGEMRIER